MCLELYYIHYLMSRRKKYTHIIYWWSEYNLCICIQGHLGCVFQLKSSILSKCLLGVWLIQIVHLKNTLILRGHFWRGRVPTRGLTSSQDTFKQGKGIFTLTLKGRGVSWYTTIYIVYMGFIKFVNDLNVFRTLLYTLSCVKEKIKVYSY